MVASDEVADGRRRDRPRRWWPLLTAALVVLLALGTWLWVSQPVASAKFCTADAGIGVDGKTYGRSLEHDCAFVDEDGNPVPPSGFADVP